SISWNTGNIEVTQNDALGTGAMTINFTTSGLMQSVDSIGDPVLENALTIATGAVSVQGEFTFPHGVTIKSGAELDIIGANSQVIVSGALAGAGNIGVNAGIFSAPGDTSLFTGGITFNGGKAIPKLTVSDAGG